VNSKAFEEAAKELGFKHIEHNKTIKDWAGEGINAEVIASKEANSRYGVGLVKNSSGKYDMVADFWGIRCYDKPSRLTELGCMSDADIQNALLRTTTKHTIVMNYRRMGFMAQVKNNADQSITVTLQR
jgi:hypothetical protein